MRRSFPPGTAARAASTQARPPSGSLPKTRSTSATDRLNMKVKVMPDEAAFYGPKIDVKLVDAIGRLWQLSTVQFDFTLPRAVRTGVHRRGRQGASAADGTPRAVRFRRALLRDSDRTLRGRVPGLARSGAGDRAADHGPQPGVRQTGSRAAGECRPARRGSTTARRR